MSDRVPPTPGAFVGRMRMLDCAVALPAVVVIIFYNTSLLDLSKAEWRAFTWTIAAYALGAAVLIELTRTRSLAPVLDWLGARAAGTPVEPGLSREAFRVAVVQPRAGVLRLLVAWLLAPPFICLGMWIGTDGDVGIDRRFFVLLVSSLLGALISSAFGFFTTKRLFGDLRPLLAEEIPDTEERAALVVPTSLVRKVQYVVLGAVVGSSLLVVTLAQSQAARAIEADALAWQGRMLAALDARLRDGGTGRDAQAEPEPEAGVEADAGPDAGSGAGAGVGFDDVLAALVPDTDLMPYPTRFFLRDPRTLDRGDTGVEGRARKRILEALGEGETNGAVGSAGGSSGVSWRRTADGRLLLAVLPDTSGLHAASGALYGMLLVSVALLGALGLGVAWLMGDDFRRGTEALAREAERLAAGDLRKGRVWEAEDEMGGLGRAFERMAESLRATVGRVAGAADRVDAAAAEITSVSQSVAVASADQVRRIQQANELMLQIRDQVSGVSDSAQALNVSVEESSSSILELGAAGDELNDTALVLSSKVEEVSGSIEQMVRSVKQVSATTDGLSEAAGDTSSSMEEMASAMRAVDNTAALTANLSTDVVSLAESGQTKVSETIRGMEAIRDATDAAERVIRGLGSRAMEIGGILDVIDDVADETNLLALNAAIIAAQAGEHGRAFSVVADEIKELADRVLASTKEIGGLIRSVQEESDNAIGAIEAGSASVATGVERSAEAGSALEEITRAARESGERIGQIVGAVREQTKATAHVAELMEGVRTGVEQISTAGSEQDRANEVVYRSAVTMREVAQQVRRTTEEQSRGFSRIRESVEGVREAVERINTSLQDQTNACTQVASFLEQVFEGTRSNEEAAQRMGTSMRDLLRQAEALREDVAKFRV